MSSDGATESAKRTTERKYLNGKCSAVRFTDYGFLPLRDPSSKLLGYFQLSAAADKGDVLAEFDCKGDFET